MIKTPYRLLSLFCLICALALIAVKSHASLITLLPDINGPAGRTFIRSYAAAGTGFITEGHGMDTDVVTALPQVGSTAVTATADSSVGSLYAFDTTRFSASWTAALRGSGTATTETFLAFEIGPHDVYYQLDGFYTGLLSGGMGAFFHTEMGDSFEASLGFTHHPVAEFAPIRESGPFQYSFSYTGILHAGDTVAFQQFSTLLATRRLRRE